METITIQTLAKQAWCEIKSNYLAWTSLTLLSVGVHYLLFIFPLSQLLIGTQLYGTFFGLLITSIITPMMAENMTFFFANKYFLALNRNPRIVKRHFLASIKYSLLDGGKHRLRFMGLFFTLVVGASIALTSLHVLPIISFISTNFTYSSFESNIAGTIFVIVGAVLTLAFCFILLNANIFLVAFIAQDTLSADNQLPALSFVATVKKSIFLMRGQKRTYFKIISFSIVTTVLFLVMSGTLQADVLLTTHSPFLQQCLYFVLTILRIATLDVFIVALKTVWADELMARDSSIVDYEGDDETRSEIEQQNGTDYVLFSNDRDSECIVEHHHAVQSDTVYALIAKTPPQEPTLTDAPPSPDVKIKQAV